MKIAVLFTSHRQFPELDFHPAFFDRTTRLKKEADILFHCNNAVIDEAALRQKLEKIPARSVTLRYAPQENTGGYPYGQFEAISDMWRFASLQQWDWVIHLHPDLFIADERPLLAALEAAEADGKQLLVSKVFGHRAPSFATDCFAFKPLPHIQPIFDAYRPFLKTPIVVALETIFFIEVHRSGVPYVIAPRHRHGHYHRDIDGLGVWHEHDLRRVAAYLKSPSSRWWYTAEHCLRHPWTALRTVTQSIGRSIKGIPQDSLPAQWSRIEEED